MSYDPQRAIKRHRRLDEIEDELKTIEKKLYWRLRAKQIALIRRDDAVAALLRQFERDARL
ncbi:hypothetical protein Q2941_29430 [Bradyrhizobium sp. UFLA05-153]